MVRTGAVRWGQGLSLRRINHVASFGGLNSATTHANTVVDR
jgi:hypothetical protein